MNFETNLKPEILSERAAEEKKALIDDFNRLTETTCVNPDNEDFQKFVKSHNYNFAKKLADCLQKEIAEQARERNLMIQDFSKLMEKCCTYPVSTSEEFDEIVRLSDEFIKSHNYRLASELSLCMLDELSRQVKKKGIKLK